MSIQPPGATLKIPIVRNPLIKGEIPAITKVEGIDVPGIVSAQTCKLPLKIPIPCKSMVSNYANPTNSSMMKPGLIKPCLIKPLATPDHASECNNLPCLDWEDVLIKIAKDTKWEGDHLIWTGAERRAVKSKFKIDRMANQWLYFFENKLDPRTVQIKMKPCAVKTCVNFRHWNLSSLSKENSGQNQENHENPIITTSDKTNKSNEITTISPSSSQSSGSIEASIDGLSIGDPIYDINWNLIENNIKKDMEEAVNIPDTDGYHLVSPKFIDCNSRKYLRKTFNKISKSINQWIELCRTRQNPTTTSPNMRRICMRLNCIRQEHWVNDDDSEDTFFKTEAFKLNKHIKREDGCLLWTGSLDKDGYGNTTFNNNNSSCHEAAILIHLRSKELNKGISISHRCPKGHKHCLEITHLQIISSP